MTYLIKRDDALAVILDNSKWPKYNAIEDIPAIDIATIREDALREAMDAIADYPRVAPDETEAQHYDEQIAHCQSILLSLIEKGAADGLV